MVICNNTVADAIFNVIARHPDNNEIQEKAINALNVSIATEADVNRALKLLRNHFISPKIEDLKHAIVALNGASLVYRLYSEMEQLNAQKELLKSLKFLVETSALVPERIWLVRCCLNAIKNLLANTDPEAANYAWVVEQLLQCGRSNKLKVMLQEQKKKKNSDNTIPSEFTSNSEPSNPVVDLMRCISTISRAGKLRDLSLDSFIEDTSIIMRSFQTDAAIQAACLDVLAAFASTPAGARSIFSGGCMKFVIQIMASGMKCERVQVAGLNLWAAALTAGPYKQNVDALKKAGAEEVLQSILRAHPNCALIKTLLIPVQSALISMSEILDRTLRTLKQAVEVRLLV